MSKMPASFSKPRFDVQPEGLLVFAGDSDHKKRPACTTVASPRLFQRIAFFYLSSHCLAAGPGARPGGENPFQSIGMLRLLRLRMNRRPPETIAIGAPFKYFHSRAFLLD